MIELPEGRRAFRVNEVAELLGISTSTVWEAISSGNLPAFKLKKCVLISERALQERIAQLEAQFAAELKARAA